MSLSIYSPLLTQIKNIGGLNKTINRDTCTLIEQLNNTNYYKVIPLFHYDTVDDIELNGEGFFITDKEKITYQSMETNALHIETILTTAKIEDKCLLWVVDTIGNPRVNAFVEIYVSDDGETYELIRNNRTDVTGQIIYTTDSTYVKFVYDGEEIICH